MSKRQHQDNERQLPDETISGTLGAKPSSSHGEDVVTIERRTMLFAAAHTVFKVLN